MNILDLTRAMDTGGTEKIILQLIDVQRQMGYKVFVCSDGGKYVKQLQQDNVTHFKIKDIDNKSPLVMLTIANSLIHIINDNQISVVHTHHRMAAFYVELLRKLGLIHVQHLHTQHNVFHDKKFLTRFSLNRVPVVAVGERVKNNLVLEYGIPQNSITVVSNSVKKDSVKYVSSTVTNREFRVLNIGRLSEQKGMEYFIRAAAILARNAHLEFKFFIAGDGPDRGNLERLVNTLNVGDKVTFLGFEAQINELIQKCDLVVLSSLWEGLPLTPIEAFSNSRTVVATEIDGTSEIIKNDYNGILVPPKDSSALAAAIEELGIDQEKRNRLELAALQTYKENFSYEKFVERYRRFYLKSVK